MVILAQCTSSKICNVVRSFAATVHFNSVHSSVVSTAVIFLFSAVLGSLGKARVNSLIRTGASHAHQAPTITSLETKEIYMHNQDTDELDSAQEGSPSEESSKE